MEDARSEIQDGEAVTQSHGPKEWEQLVARVPMHILRDPEALEFLYCLVRRTPADPGHCPRAPKSVMYAFMAGDTWLHELEAWKHYWHSIGRGSVRANSSTITAEALASVQAGWKMDALRAEFDSLGLAVKALESKVERLEARSLLERTELAAQKTKNARLAMRGTHCKASRASETKGALTSAKRSSGQIKERAGSRC